MFYLAIKQKYLSHSELPGKSILNQYNIKYSPTVGTDSCQTYQKQFDCQLLATITTTKAMLNLGYGAETPNKLFVPQDLEK